MENYISTITEIEIVGVDPQYLGWSMPGTLQAIVRDNYHNLVPGAVVTFTAPDACPSLTFTSSNSTAATTVTDSSGMATLSVLANPVQGSYTVAAVVDGTGVSVNFSMVNIYFLSQSIWVRHDWYAKE